MEKKAVYSMTEGSPAKLLLKFTIPMLIGNLFQQFYNMVDSIVVGRFVGSNALAAVGATGSLNFLFFAMSFGIAAGVGVVVSQYFGAERMDMVEKSIINGMYLLAAVSALMGVIGIVSARWVLVALDTPEIILDDAVIYMRVSCAGAARAGGLQDAALFYGGGMFYQHRARLAVCNTVSVVCVWRGTRDGDRADGRGSRGICIRAVQDSVFSY